MSQILVTGEAKIRDIQGPVVSNSGVITALNGGASQYVRGDGTLADFPTSTGGGSSVTYYLNSSVSQGTIGGVAYRQLSKTPISGAGTDIAISTTGYVASYLTDANDPALLEVPAGNFNCEFYFSVNSNSHNPYVYAELYKYDGTTFTLLGSNVAIPEYLTNGTTLSAYYFAIPVAVAALTVTDRIAIRIYVNVDGRVVTLHTENNHLCQVVTTFSKGLISLNNLTRQNQFFGTGTSGTDFAISSSVATHTFNLPVASAANTGKLSSTDWSTFNNKQATLSFTAPLVNTSNTISIPVATSIVDGYLDNADWVNFNTAYNNMIVSAAVTGTTTKTLTLTQQDAGTITASWTDDNTDAVTSVFGRTGAVVATSGDYTTTQVTEGTNLYFTDARARAAISLTTTGTSGAATYTSGVLNIPQYQGLLTNPITGTGATTEIAYFNGTTSITSEAAFNYDASLNRLGVNTTNPNATIGGNSALDAGYGLLIKTGAANYNGIGIAIDSTYGNLISTEKLGTATARNLTLLNQSGFVSLKENGNFGDNTLNPSVSGTGIDVYSSTSTGIRFHTATSGTTVTDGAGINFSAANNLGISNYEAGTIDIVTNGNSGVFIDTNGFVGINGATPSVALTVTGAGLFSTSLSVAGLTTGQVLFPTSGGLLSGSANLFWDNTNNRLGLGTTNPQRSLTIFNATLDSQLQVAGGAPSVALTDAVTGGLYQAKFAMATVAGHYVSGSVAGDFILLSQTGATIFATSSTEKARITSGGNFLVGTGTDNGSILQIKGTKPQLIVDGNTVGCGISLSNTISGANRRNWGIFTEENVDGDFVIKRSTTAGGAANTTVLSLLNTGAATFASSIAATSATFTNASGAFIAVTATTTDATGSARLRVTSTGGNVNDFSSFSASHASRANQAWIGGDGSSLTTVLQAGGVEFLRGASTGDATFSSSVTINSSSLLKLGNSDNASTMQIWNSQSGAANNLLVYDNAASAYRFVINSSGLVGIGTSSPANKLQVNGTAGNIATDLDNGCIFQLNGGSITTANNGISLLFGRAGDQMAYIGAARENGTDSASFLSFATQTSAGAHPERMRITSGGNVLIGTTDSAINSGVGIKLLNDSNKHISAVSTDSTNANGESFIMYSTGAAAYRFYVGWGGTIYATSPVISGISDVRLKENIRDIKFGLKEIMLLKPRDFDWKEGKGKNIKNDRGFIAQEFEEVFPDLIDIAKDPVKEGETPYKTIRQDLIPVLVKAVQEQTQIIKELEARIKQLENK